MLSHLLQTSLLTNVAVVNGKESNIQTLKESSRKRSRKLITTPNLALSVSGLLSLNLYLQVAIFPKSQKINRLIIPGNVLVFARSKARSYTRLSLWFYLIAGSQGKSLASTSGNIKCCIAFVFPALTYFCFLWKRCSNSVNLDSHRSVINFSAMQ